MIYKYSCPSLGTHARADIHAHKQANKQTYPLLKTRSSKNYLSSDNKKS